MNCVPDDENTELTPLAPVALLGVLVRITSPKLLGANPVSVTAELELPDVVPLVVPDMLVPPVVVAVEPVPPEEELVPPEDVWAKLAALSARRVAMP